MLGWSRLPFSLFDATRRLGLGGLAGSGGSAVEVAQRRQAGRRVHDGSMESPRGSLGITSGNLTSEWENRHAFIS